MRRFIDGLRAVILAAAMLLGLFAGAQLASANGASCESSFGTKVPVLLVHGLDSSPRMWDEGSNPMSLALSVDGAAIVEAFDYSVTASEWIDQESGTGRKLAETIDCLAQASTKNGGRGKVIVVAHSMGGLATRFAANEEVDGRKVADQIGLVVTIGTPHMGSGLGNLCQTYTLGVVGECAGSAPEALGSNSRELQALSHFPEGLPVRAIAGHVYIRADFGFAHIDTDMGGDLVVGVDSAMAEYTETGSGDGGYILKCTGTGAIPGHSTAPCEHSAMIQNPKVQEWVRDGIRDYLAATTPASAKSHDFYGLQLQLPAKWEVIHRADFQTGVRDPGACFDSVVFDGEEECAGFVVTNLSAEPDGTYDGYCEGEVTEEPTKVGGLSATLVTSRHCSGGVDTLRTWSIPSKNLMVESRSYKNYPLEGLEKALADATWK